MPRKSATGDYRQRVVILARVLAAQGANGEEVESWPDPTPGTNEYQAAEESLTGGETIVQGLRQATGGKRLRIKGRFIAVNAYDRIKVKATGEYFAVTGMYRDLSNGTTVLTVERVHQQTTGQ
jgi:head-tail adaptor